MAQINSLFMTKTAENHTLQGHTKPTVHVYSPYTGGL